MGKYLLLLTLLLFAGTAAFAQQVPKAFKYQAVARDAANLPYANTNLRLRIGVANEGGVVAYSETHNVTTSDLGMFHLNIGQGTIVSGNFGSINWGAGAYFLNVELSTNNGASYFSMGASPLLSVPYALYAERANTVDGATSGDNWGTQAVQTTPTLSGNGTATSPLNIPDNAITSAKIQNGTIQAADMAPGVIPTYTAGSGINISGNAISASDNSSTNELQTISLSGANLSLSNGGGSVTLPTGTTYTAGSGITITGNTIRAIDNSDLNELQTLSLDGNELSLSDGNAVILPTGGSSYWENAGGNDIINNNGATVFFAPAQYQTIFAAADNNSQTIVAQQNGTGLALRAEATNASGPAVEIVGGFIGLDVSGNATGIRGINVGPVGGFGVYGESMVPFGTGGAFRNENGTGLEVTGALEICYLSGFGGYYCPRIKGVSGVSNALEVGADWRPDAINSGIRNLGAPNARWNTIFAVNGLINTSDAREKQAIQPLGYGLQQVMAMNPVSFEWSRHPERGRKIGFLAQELQHILPEVVADKEWQADENGVMQPKEATALGVYYSDIIPVLTKAIQEQQGQIAVQAAEISALKAALETQTQLLAQLLARLDK